MPKTKTLFDWLFTKNLALYWFINSMSFDWLLAPFFWNSPSTSPWMEMLRLPVCTILSYIKELTITPFNPSMMAILPITGGNKLFFWWGNVEVWVNLGGNDLKFNISSPENTILPTVYTCPHHILLFPTGQHGWCWGLHLCNIESGGHFTEEGNDDVGSEDDREVSQTNILQAEPEHAKGKYGRLSLAGRLTTKSVTHWQEPWLAEFEVRWNRVWGGSEGMRTRQTKVWGGTHKSADEVKVGRK